MLIVFDSRNPAVLAALALVALAAGCSAPGYVVQQAWGQLMVMHDRERITDMLRRRDLPKNKRRKLTLVLRARRYAHEQIGLALTDAYTRYYDTGGQPMAHNISACDKASLRPKIWRFPIVGGLPFIGFFEKSEAVKAEAALRVQGLDTYLRPVPAFSSLGWFADPVYSQMLTGSEGRLVDTVIHEMTHTTLHLPNSSAFNESFAVFVGNQGALNFLAGVYGPQSPQVKALSRRILRRKHFSKLVATLYNRLDRLYSSDLPRAQKLARRPEHFAWAQRRYKELFPDPKHWGRFVRRPLNNAVLLSYGRYNTGLRFHYLVYRAMGRDLRRTVALYKFATNFSDPIAYVARRCGLRWFIKQEM